MGRGLGVMRADKSYIRTDIMLRLWTTKDKLLTVALYQDRLQSVSFLSFRGVKGFVIEEQRLAKE